MEKVIFLDRDGVINRDSFGRTINNYVQKWQDFAFVNNSKEGIKLLNEKGFEIIVISNQAGVAKGYYTKATLDEITNNMIKEIEGFGGKIKKVFYCTHQDDDNCNCRKPKTGLFHKAALYLKKDIKNCFFVGDTQRDVIAGREFGLRTITVLTGRNNCDDIKSWTYKPDVICRDLLEVAELIKEDIG